MEIFECIIAHKLLVIIILKRWKVFIKTAVYNGASRISKYRVFKLKLSEKNAY